VVLNCADDIQTDTNRLLQPGFASDTLRAFDGQWHGGLKPGPGKKTDDVIQDWSKTNQFVSWAVRVENPAMREVLINYVANSNSVGNKFTVNIGNQMLEGTVQSNSTNFLSLGNVSLPKGNFEIKVAAKEIKDARAPELFKLRSIELRQGAQ